MKDETYDYEWSTSKECFIKHYEAGGDSGGGSRGQLAEFKAQVLNAFVKINNVQSVIEFGCGDGYQLSLAEYPQYLGFDVAPKAIELCCELFKEDETKDFKLLDYYAGEQAELVISQDVLLHLYEDETWEEHLGLLFEASTKYVVIYAADMDLELQGCQRFRKFTPWIEEHFPHYKLVAHVPNKYPDTIPPTHDDKSNAEFFIYKKEM